MVKFCFECGHKLQYKFSAPNFCPNCGTSIGANQKAQTQVEELFKKSVASDDGYTNSEYVPKISKLDFEIEDFGASIQHTIGSLGGHQTPRRRINQVRDLNNL